MLSVPEVVASGDTFATDGLLLEITTFTPPWLEAPRVPVLFSCRPDPTVVALVVIPGAVTVTTWLAPGSAMNPGIDADTVVVPAASGSNSTPPAAFDVGDRYELTATGTVTLFPVVVFVTSCPTVPLLFTIVTVSGVPPPRISWKAAMDVFPAFGLPTPTKNALLADSDVVLAGGEVQYCTAGWTTVADAVPSVNPGAEAVIVTVPVWPSIPCT
jgi:hypothetical protein